MPNFLLLLHQTLTTFRNSSPEEIQKILGSYIAWRESLVKRNKMRGGEKLTDDGGRQPSTQGGKVSVTDGPFSESQEILGDSLIEAERLRGSRRDRADLSAPCGWQMD